MSNLLIDIRPLLDKPYTGVAQYTLNFLNETLEKNKENNYFLFYNSAKYQNKDLPIFNYPNVRIVDFHYPNKIFNFLLWFFKWPKIDKLVEKRIGQKIDEIFLPNFNFFAFSKNKKITLVAHDLSFEIYPQFFTFKQRFWHKLVNPKKICQMADKIITHSENTKNDIIRFYKIDPSKIEIKKPAIAQKFFEAIDEKEKARVKEKYQLPDNFIFYLGNLEPRKNIETLINAFHQLMISDSLLAISLIIAGRGKEQNKLKRRVNNLGVGERVRFLGYIPEEDKKAIYHLAKVFVYPSFYEGYGYPVVEAISGNTLVITSHTSSLTEIESDKIIFINPNDINDLFQALKESMAKFL